MRSTLKSIFIIHGSNGSKNAHWYPWLKRELEKNESKKSENIEANLESKCKINTDVQVFLPQFPIQENQTLQNWMNTIKPFESQFQDSIFIGHSLGVPFILNILNQTTTLSNQTNARLNRLNSAFLVSGFSGKLETKEAKDEPNIDDFAERDFNWERIRNNCKRFYVIHSDNDPYVPKEKAEEVNYPALKATAFGAVGRLRATRGVLLH